MSALLAHADAAKCMATAFARQAHRERECGSDGWPERSELLGGMSRAYAEAAQLMEEECRRQVTGGNDT